jgi:hypothetical protein
MELIVSHLEMTQICCDVDDFCQQFERLWQQRFQLPSMVGEKRSRSRLHLSEGMTIVIACHGSGYESVDFFVSFRCLTYPRMDCGC